MSINLIPSFADLAAIVLSTIALIVAIKNRRSPLRENIYNRQLDVCNKLIDSIIEIEYAIENRNALIIGKIEFNKIEKANLKIDKLYSKFELLYDKNLYLIPDKVDVQMHSLASYFSNLIIDFNEQGSNPQPINLFSMNDEIFKLEHEIREYYGLEKLSIENRKLANSKK